MHEHTRMHACMHTHTHTHTHIHTHTHTHTHANTHICTEKEKYRDKFKVEPVENSLFISTFLLKPHRQKVASEIDESNENSDQTKRMGKKVKCMQTYL